MKTREPTAEEEPDIENLIDPELLRTAESKIPVEWIIVGVVGVLVLLVVILLVLLLA